MDVGSVGGVIEIDEAFFRESFKANHNKSTIFTMPRKSHKRGVNGSTDEKRKRYISMEQVCVLCAMDRAGNIIKNKNLLVQSHTFYSDTKIKDLRIREIIFV